MLRLRGVDVGDRLTAPLTRAASVLSSKLVRDPGASAMGMLDRCRVRGADGLSISVDDVWAASAGTDADVLGTACRGAETQAFEAPSDAAGALRCVVNQVRRDRALPILRRRWRDRVLHVAEMVARGYFSHTSPGGATIGDRMRRRGYLQPGRGWRVGETLGVGDRHALDAGRRRAGVAAQPAASRAAVGRALPRRGRRRRGWGAGRARRAGAGSHIRPGSGGARAMMWWILAGISVWAIIVFWIICILRVAALSDRRHEEAVRASREHSDRFARERAGELDELEQAWQRPRERSGDQDRW